MSKEQKIVFGLIGLSAALSMSVLYLDFTYSELLPQKINEIISFICVGVLMTDLVLSCGLGFLLGLSDSFDDNEKMWENFREDHR